MDRNGEAKHALADVNIAVSFRPNVDMINNDPRPPSKFKFIRWDAAVQVYTRSMLILMKSLREAFTRKNRKKFGVIPNWGYPPPPVW